MTTLRVLVFTFLVAAPAFLRAQVDGDLAGLEYRAKSSIEGAVPARLKTQIALVNRGSKPLHIEYGACAVKVRAFRTAARQNAVWRSERSRMAWQSDRGDGELCILILYTKDIAPGDSVSGPPFERTFPAHQILGDSLPDGRYYFSVNLELNGRTLSMSAGSAEISLAQKTPPSARTIDGLHVSGAVRRTKFEYGPDYLHVTFTVRNVGKEARRFPRKTTGIENGDNCMWLLGYDSRKSRDTYYLFLRGDWTARPCPIHIPEMTLKPGESRTLDGGTIAPPVPMHYILFFSAHDHDARLMENERTDGNLALDEDDSDRPRSVNAKEIREALALAPRTPGYYEPQRRPFRQTGLWDAHTHLSFYGPAALDSLAAHKVVAVRDLGANRLDEILQWRSEIAAGTRKGPRIFTSGVILDGPKEDSTNRWTLRTEAEAVLAVDSLAKRGVDFIKTHNGLSRPVYFAVLRAAKAHNLKVASHLPRGVPAWEAADSGASSIEHAAESMMASPIYAGYAKTFAEAFTWWKSPAGYSALGRLKKSGVYITPTLALYAANVDQPTDPAARTARREALQSLLELTRLINDVGIPIMAGSDIAGPRNDYRPGQSLEMEMSLLRRAGIHDVVVKRAAGENIARWLGQHQ